MRGGTLVVFVFVFAAFLALASCSDVCRPQWFEEDRQLIAEVEGWQFMDERRNIKVWRRESVTRHHISRMYKAKTVIPAPVDEVFKKWHTEAYEPANLAAKPYLLNVVPVESHSATSDVVYEQHHVPDYINLYPAVWHRDYLFARCVKEESNGYLISYRSVEDHRFPNATGFQRGWIIDSAVSLKPVSGGTELTIIRQRSLMCCVPSSVHDFHQPQQLEEELSIFRSLFGGQGICRGDQTTWRDDLHAACHLDITFKTSCNRVFDSIKTQSTVADPNGSGYQLFNVWSDEWCLELVHHTPSWIGTFAEDIHFEVTDSSSDNSCKLKASSRSRSPSHYDFGYNYCNLYNLLLKVPGGFDISIDNCMYRPHTNPATYCSKSTRTFKDLACSLDLFDLACKDQ